MSDLLTANPRVLCYYSRSVYGKFAAYLDESNPDAQASAQAVRRLTGRKTLLASDIDALEALGFTMQLILDPRAGMPRV